MIEKVKRIFQGFRGGYNAAQREDGKRTRLGSCRVFGRGFYQAANRENLEISIAWEEAILSLPD